MAIRESLRCRVKVVSLRRTSRESFRRCEHAYRLANSTSRRLSALPSGCATSPWISVAVRTTRRFECVPQDLPLVAYFATPAAVYGDICRFLCGERARRTGPVVLEKPIGHDLESSRVINDAVAEHFPESRIYRIDHYLGKETVQNLIALRFANSLFETQWDQHHISHVEITVAETVGIEGRAISIRPASCATWCRTTCCSCSA